jgi:competence/damage-inducible protein CinA-like protein
VTRESQPARTAAIIAVGSELLTPFRSDTNSLVITGRLNEIGIEVASKQIVGDDPRDLAAAFTAALERADLVVVTGGLGPTSDDVTRPTIAQVLDLPLEENEEVLERIRLRFAARGLAMPEINRSQAMVPRGTTALANANGTAPGLWIEVGHRRVVLLPGPPGEMQPMLDLVVREYLAPSSGSTRLYRRVLKIAGRAESYVETLAQPVYSRWLGADPPISTSILAAPGQIELHLGIRSDRADRASVSLERAVGELKAVLGADIFTDTGESLEEVVGGLLRARGWRIAVAESCTGGLTSSRLTDVPGSSDYVDRAAVTYSNRAKVEWLGVPEDLIRDRGAVSEDVAAAMAIGVRKGAGVEVGVGISGVAGPGGGTAAKPVGTVVIAIAWAGGQRVQTFRFAGGRRQVKFQSSQAALDMVRRWLLERS